MRKVLLISLVMLAVISGGDIHGADFTGFNVEEINVSETARRKPFTFTHIQQSAGELLLWIHAANISEVARLLNAGELETQTSKGDETATVPLTLWKQVVCNDNRVLTSGYSASIPANCRVVSTEYFFRAPVVLQDGRDFGIGLSPDFLWLVEKK